MNIFEKKKCYRCRELKKLNCFHRNKSKRDEHQDYCKDCIKEYYLKNESEIKRYQKKYKLKNKDKCKKYRKEYCLKNKDRNKKYQTRYRLKHKDKKKESNKEYRLKNKNKINKCLRERRKIDTIYKLNGSMRNAIGKSLRRNRIRGNKNGRHWETLVSYTLKDLRDHLERQFVDGMIWENYGKWHVDHIIPVFAFGFTKPEDLQFKECWKLSNLQPLWARDNISKSNKYLNK